MEVSRSESFIQSRLELVGPTTSTESLGLEVAGVRLRVEIPRVWFSVCARHWQEFTVAPDDCELTLKLQPSSCLDANDSTWATPMPFQFEHQSWIFHRDFTARRTASDELTIWMAAPEAQVTDALDNIVAFAVRPLAEARESFLFHSTIVEDEGRAVVFFGPSGIGKSTLAKLSLELGYRVMGSDQAYLRIEEGRLVASASPTINPDLPRSREAWAIGPLEVKTCVALVRTGDFRLESIDPAEFARRFFCEVFRDETDPDYTSALKLAARVASLDGLKKVKLSYPKGTDFWPTLRGCGYI